MGFRGNVCVINQLQDGEGRMIRDITIGQYYPAKSVIHRLDHGEAYVYTAVSNLIVFV